MSTRFQNVKNLLFGRYLWVTNTVSSGVFLTIGDVIQQNIEKHDASNKKSTMDYERIGRMGIVGLAQGPVNHWWYTWLDRVLPGKSLVVIGKKILADQVIASPFFSSTFFVGVGLLEGYSTAEAWQEYKDKFLMVYLIDCAVWPPSQLINFLFVPAVYRVLYISILTVAWNVFMSYAKHFDKLHLNKEADLFPSGTAHKRKNPTTI